MTNCQNIGFMSTNMLYLSAILNVYVSFCYSDAYYMKACRIFKFVSKGILGDIMSSMLWARIPLDRHGMTLFSKDCKSIGKGNISGKLIFTCLATKCRDCNDAWCLSMSPLCSDNTSVNVACVVSITFISVISMCTVARCAFKKRHRLN